jgi:DNA-directed RNA polymerase specialized sigma24 family protein
VSDRDAEYLEYVTGHRGRMLRTARLLTAGDTHWAEDLVQVALTKLYVHWSKVRREDGAAPYADRILVNAFFDERRRMWRRKESTTEQMYDAAPPPGQDPAERLPRRAGGGSSRSCTTRTCATRSSIAGQRSPWSSVRQSSWTRARA